MPETAALVAFLAHEARSPLTVILGNATRLARFGSSDERAQAIAHIVQAAQRLNQILDDWTELAHLGPDASSESFMVEAVIDEAIREHQNGNPSRSITLVSRSVPREALGSANWTRQILRNLLSNAEKYSPPEQPIEVDIEIDAPSLLTVHVLDRGIGIPEETAVLFEPFWRDGDARRVAGGMGIGLAVSRWLAHAQGGDIWAQPRVGGGSDFAFTVPLTKR